MEKTNTLLKATWLTMIFVFNFHFLWSSTGKKQGYQDRIPPKTPKQEVIPQVGPRVTPSDSTQSPLKSLFHGMIDWLYAPESEQKSDSSSHSIHEENSRKK